MSKLSKFLRSPLRFVRDAVAKWATRWSGVSIALDSSFRIECAIKVDQGINASVIQEALLKSTKAFHADLPGHPFVLDCFSDDLDLLCYQAFLVASALGLDFQVRALGKRFDMNAQSLAKVVPGLQRAKNLTFRFNPVNRETITLSVGIWKKQTDPLAAISSNNVPLRRLSMEDFDETFNKETSHLELFRLVPGRNPDIAEFDVDVVYTWVDHRDPNWQAMLKQHKPDAESIEWDRFVSVDELRYSLRSIHAYAPWVRNIFVVTNCAPPAWLKPNRGVTFVPHEQVFPHPEECLPTFNSHAIEACLARVPGLAEHFVYFNDDVFLSQPATKNAFFQGNGASVSNLEPYGMVHARAATDDAPDYLVAAVNGQRLMSERFDVAPTRLHHHAPHALRKSVLFQMEQVWPEVFDTVRRSRFRSRSDVSIVSFLYHHFAFHHREAIRDNASCLLVRNTNYEQAFQRLSTGKDKDTRFLCINDGGQSADDTAFQGAKVEFLRTVYPTRAPWERAV